MENWTPVLIVSGAEGFLRRRFVSNLLEECLKEGWTVDSIDGRDATALESILSGGVFLNDHNMVLVTHPEKLDPERIEAHHAAGDSTFVLLLHCEGDPDSRTKFGKLVKKLEKQHRIFASPKPWEADGVAVDFVLKEVGRFGKTMARSEAQSLVAVVGSDLGVLHFELLKAATLADARGSEVITKDHLKGSLAALLEADVQPVIRALEGRNLAKVIKGLERIRVTTKSDPTMMICRILGSTLLKWLGAANLDARGIDPKEAASLLGVNNAWFYQNQILPPALSWKQPGLIRLVQALAQTERSLLGGHADPWSGLLARLAAAWTPSG